MVSLDRFRELAMRMPRVEELDHFGTPSFRVRGKIFAQFPRGGSDAIFKFSRDELDVLSMSAGDLFVPDPSWGKHGWTHVHIAEMDEAWVDQLLRDAWRRVTPKKMHGELNSGAGGRFPVGEGVSMFVAIYRWRLHPERESDFVANWQRITLNGLAAGSGGSSLFRNAQGSWVAIARWPSRAARDRFFAELDGSSDEPEMSQRARLAVIERLPDEELDGVLDCWAPFPDIGGSTRA